LRILGHQTTRRLIDFSQPTGLLLVSVLPPTPYTENTWQIVATLRNALAPGSYLALCHATNEGRPEVLEAMGKAYRSGVGAGGGLRSAAEVLRFFDGFDLVDPGLVHVPLWRPDAPGDLPDDPTQFWVLAGVARKH